MPILISCNRCITRKTKSLNTEWYKSICLFLYITMIKNNPVITQIIKNCLVFWLGRNNNSLLEFWWKILDFIFHPWYFISKVFKSTMKGKMNPTMSMFSIRITPYYNFIVFIVSHKKLFLSKYMKFFPISKLGNNPERNKKYNLK